MPTSDPHPATTEQCEYVGCRDSATWDVRMNGRMRPLCDEHVKPQYHPPDLHRQLPGALRRAVRQVRSYGGRA